MPVLLAIALHAEARPVIARFRLKQDASFELPVFRREEVWLTVTGTGSMKSAIAITCLLTRVERDEDTVLFNLGIAGHTQQAEEGPVSVGDRFLANKITERSTGRSFFPDLLARTPLEESVVTTVERPLDRADAGTVEPGLADMEAAGFYQAAATFLPPHRIGCVKVVSDHLETRRTDKNRVGELVAGALDEFEATVAAYRSIDDGGKDVLTGADLRLVQDIRDRLRLTASRHRMLSDLARSYKLHTGSDLPDLKWFTHVSVNTRQEGDAQFERLRGILSVE
ncbi:MAG: hypothetical protein F4014_05680 [Gemmatimonadetes bacterium]|nr:hypothetical protein [Gemmatimonadota bacterium]MYH18209.1 hypothetical protein [Gemmatimonadota bacterium]MYK98302.1 hypothetical protein [Gemmatimonadota bacterium]